MTNPICSGHYCSGTPVEVCEGCEKLCGCGLPGEGRVDLEYSQRHCGRLRKVMGVCWLTGSMIFMGGRSGSCSQWTNVPVGNMGATRVIWQNWLY